MKRSSRWRSIEERNVVDSFRLFHIERKFLLVGKNRRVTPIIRFSFLEHKIIKWKDSKWKNKMNGKRKKYFLLGLIVQHQVMIKHFFVLFCRWVGFGITPRQRYLAETERILPIDQLSIDSLYTSSSSNMSRVGSIFPEDNSSLHEHHLVEHINSGSDHPMDCYLILSIRASTTCSSSTEIVFFSPSSSRFNLPNSYGKFFRQFDSKYRRFNCVRSPKQTSLSLDHRRHEGTNQFETVRFSVGCRIDQDKQDWRDYQFLQESNSVWFERSFSRLSVPAGKFFSWLLHIIKYRVWIW